MQVKVKKLHPDAVIPKYAKDGDAGLDLTAISKEENSKQVIYGTGLAVEIPYGYVGLIFPRSSIMKKDLSLTNSVGVIDSGYRGEIKFAFRKHDTTMPAFGFPIPSESYEVGDRIGQLIIMPYPSIELVESEELSSTERGEGGFGSSGK